MIQNKQRFNFKSKLLSVVEGNTDAAVLLAFCEMQQIVVNSSQEAEIYWSLPVPGSVIGLSRSRLDSARRLLRESGEFWLREKLAGLQNSNFISISFFLKGDSHRRCRNLLNTRRSW